MARSIDDVIADIDLPMPQPGGEDLGSYARRIATIGAHHGAAWALTTRPPAIVYTQPQAAPEAQTADADAEGVPTASGTLNLTSEGNPTDH